MCTTFLFFTVISSTIAGRIDFHLLIGNDVKKKSHFPPFCSEFFTIALLFEEYTISLNFRTTFRTSICGIVNSVPKESRKYVCLCMHMLSKSLFSIDNCMKKSAFFLEMFGMFAIRVVQYGLAVFFSKAGLEFPVQWF